VGSRRGTALSGIEGALLQAGLYVSVVTAQNTNMARGVTSTARGDERAGAERRPRRRRTATAARPRSGRRGAATAAHVTAVEIIEETQGHLEHVATAADVDQLNHIAQFFLLGPENAIRYIYAISSGGLFFSVLATVGMMLCTYAHDNVLTNPLTVCSFFAASKFRALRVWMFGILGMHILQFKGRLEVIKYCHICLHRRDLVGVSAEELDAEYSRELNYVLRTPYFQFLKDLGTPMMIFHFIGFILFFGQGVMYWKTFDSHDVQFFHLVGLQLIIVCVRLMFVVLTFQKYLAMRFPAIPVPQISTGLLPADMEAFECCTYAEHCEDSKNDEDDENPPTTCVICLEDFFLDDTILALQCSQKHVFHKDCIFRWFESRRHCPLCNRCAGRRSCELDHEHWVQEHGVL